MKKGEGRIDSLVWMFMCNWEGRKHKSLFGFFYNLFLLYYETFPWK
jgi:hypothetical protein